MIFLLALLAFVSFRSDIQLSQSKKLFIGALNTREPMTGARIFSFSQDNCYVADLDGMVVIPFVRGDSFQIENTGYRLLRYSYFEMMKVDSIYIAEIGSLDLGTTGLEPFLEYENYRNKCRCCQH